MHTIKKYLDEGSYEFKSIKELMQSCEELPYEKGVYMVLRTSNDAPTFLKEGTGGFFKGKDPNVSIEELEDNWIDDEPILYIGQTGGNGSSNTLQRRIRQNILFGQGKNIGHYGGRYIWQLADAAELLVCWKPLADNDPKQVEEEMMQIFKQVHNGRRPFANLIG